jgi:hypothetical protein
MSGGDLEQVGDEDGLASDVTPADVSNPPPDHRHRLETRQRSSRRPEPAKAIVLPMVV